MRSIVDHKHQKAAYCGITWFDSDVYPEEYRKVLYMGNIHGGCINADVVERDGSTYKGRPHPGFTAKPGAWDADEFGLIAKAGNDTNPKLADFLTANDAWFMPVVQTTGPDGCLYVLDWYDRYHCYQDANADPTGVEREKGRLYRVRYQDTPHAQPFDLNQKSDDELIALLDGGNEYVRTTARRLLAERLSAQPDAGVVAMLKETLFQEGNAQNTAARLQALWTLASAGLVDETILSFDKSDDDTLRSWAVRISRDQYRPRDLYDGWGRLHALEDEPRTKLQNLVGIGKMDEPVLDRSTLLLMAMGTGQVDPLIQHVGWQNLVPLVEAEPDSVLHAAYSLLGQKDMFGNTATQELILPRLVAMACTHPRTTADPLVRLLGVVLKRGSISATARQQVVTAISTSLREGSIPGDQVNALRNGLLEQASLASAAAEGSLLHQLTVLRALLGETQAQAALHDTFSNESLGHAARMEALEALVATGDKSVTTAVSQTLASTATDARLRESIVSMLGQVNDPAVAQMLLERFESFPPDLQPKAVEVLTQRPEWSTQLLLAIQAKQIDKEALNLNQLRRVALFNHENLRKLVEEVYGTVRTDRGTDRQGLVNRMRDFLHGTPGDPVRGEAAFKKVCGQCHKLHGEGAEVGPDITRNGRNNWEQLLHNVFDPSAVIGPGYESRQLLTTDGRVLTGLPVEESDQRVVLKIQGGKLETIPKGEIELYQASELSMMPEDLEKQLQPQEIADLFSFLALDKHPSDPDAKFLPGAPRR